MCITCFRLKDYSKNDSRSLLALQQSHDTWVTFSSLKRKHDHKLVLCHLLFHLEEDEREREKTEQKLGRAQLISSKKYIN